MEELKFQKIFRQLLLIMLSTVAFHLERLDNLF